MWPVHISLPTDYLKFLDFNSVFSNELMQRLRLWEQLYRYFLMDPRRPRGKRKLMQLYGIQVYQQSERLKHPWAGKFKCQFSKYCQFTWAITQGLKTDLRKSHRSVSTHYLIKGSKSTETGCINRCYHQPFFPFKKLTNSSMPLSMKKGKPSLKQSR